MPKVKLFAAIVLIVCSAVLSYGLANGMFGATCKGSDPCNACKNCKYCKHCAKDGGKCGVCKK